jgi:Arc/MetJ-type ribon-helix-helix transcriptional regulator
MPEKKYITISIPIEIHNAMKEIVEMDGSLYTNVSDLAKDALRSKIEKIRSQNKEWGAKK